MELILLMDSRDGDGTEAWVRLEENDMVLFLQDPDIVAFTDTTTTPPLPKFDRAND